MSKLSENIKKYRKKHHLTQSEFANKLFVSKQAVSKWETSKGYPESSMIPDIANVMGITIDELMGEKKINKKVVITISLLLLSLVLSVVFVPQYLNNQQAINEFTEFKTHIEMKSNLVIPDKGYVVNADIDKWASYGNAVFVEQMSYIVFNEYNQTEVFEDNLSSSDKWVTSVQSNLVDIIPSYLQSYTVIGDYYCIYNESKDVYNDVPNEPGNHNYTFLIYQLENNRLVVFDFTVHVAFE